MSVLKYNNNGTWEGLNIDHASTADSALYDADGNVISSTYAKATDLGLYLPLTAGSSKPLTDDLYVYKASGSSGVYGYHDGTLRSFHGATGNSALMAAYDANGEESGRITINQGNGYVTIAGNGLGYILFRPNGYNSTTGQVYVGTDGLLNGTMFSTGTISHASDGVRGYWARQGRICVFSCYMNISSFSANTWTQWGKAGQTIPAPVGQEPRFAAIVDSGTGYTVQQIGVARLTTARTFQVAFPTASSSAKAITVSGAYRCDNNGTS